MSRRERIEFLLDHWPDFFQVDSSTGGKGDADGPGPMLPSMSRHPSVRELARSVTILRLVLPSEYRHLAAYYGAAWRTRPLTRPVAKGKPVGPARARERLLPAWLRDAQVARGVALVELVYRGEPFIPDELLYGEEELRERRKRREG